jgi:CheY-like chemotaxis protein
VDAITVLVVEDEGIVGLDLRNQLNALGHDVVGVVATGKRAIEKAEQMRPDLVLMDVRLKGELDGIQAAQIIVDRFDTPIVFLTALLDEETLERTRTIRRHGYLIKPFMTRELESAIREAMK